MIKTLTKLKPLIVMTFLFTLSFSIGVGKTEAAIFAENPHLGVDVGAVVEPPSNHVQLTISKDTYQFVDHGKLINKTTGEKADSLYSAIMRDKQNSTMTDIHVIMASNLVTTSIRGGVYTDSGSLWSPDYDMKKWLTNTSPTIIYLEGGNIAYKIEIPAGNGGKDNQAIINNAIRGVEDYKKMIQESVYVGLMTGSYNIYSMTPSKQIPLENILEKDGTVYKLKSSSTGVKIDYALKYYYHPISGKTESSVIGKTEADVKKFIDEAKIKTIFTEGATKDRIDFTVHPDYTAFQSDLLSNGSMYTKVEGSSVISSNGVKSYTTGYNKKNITANSRVDGTFSLALPELFVDSDNTYKIANVGGYRIDKNISLLLSTVEVYKNAESGAKERLGDFDGFGLNLKGLAMVPLYVDKEGVLTNDTKNASQIGVIVPLWFKETVIKTPEEGTEISGTDSYFTGRIVKLNNDYNTKTRLDEINKDLISVDTSVTGMLGIAARRFAFQPESAYANRQAHTTIGTKPDSFIFHTSFESDPTAPYRGFVMYRNNSYLSDDRDLIEWLKTDTAKALTDVKAEELLSIITGDLGFEDKTLGYEEWLRMQEIKGELESSTKNQVKSAFVILSIIVGYLIIVYSIFMSIAYWFDIVNSFFEFSLLKLVTGGRLYAIPNKEAIEYVSSVSGDNVKYVTYWNVLTYTILGIFVGLFFVNVTPVIEFILWLYYLISDTLGVK